MVDAVDITDWVDAVDILDTAIFADILDTAILADAGDLSGVLAGRCRRSGVAATSPPALTARSSCAASPPAAAAGAGWFFPFFIPDVVVRTLVSLDSLHAVSAMQLFTSAAPRSLSLSSGLRSAVIMPLGARAAASCFRRSVAVQEGH